MLTAVNLAHPLFGKQIQVIDRPERKGTIEGISLDGVHVNEITIAWQSDWRLWDDVGQTIAGINGISAVAGSMTSVTYDNAMQILPYLKFVEEVEDSELAESTPSSSEAFDEILEEAEDHAMDCGTLGMAVANILHRHKLISDETYARLCEED